MAGTYVAGGKDLTVPIMFVRHGQSTNNPIYEGLYAKQKAGKINLVGSVRKVNVN
jgi:hypothetical protein